MKNLRYHAKAVGLAYLVTVAMPMNTGCEYAALAQVLMQILPYIMQAMSTDDPNAQADAIARGAAVGLQQGGGALTQIAAQQAAQQAAAQRQNAAGGTADRPTQGTGQPDPGTARTDGGLTTVQGPSGGTTNGSTTNNDAAATAAANATGGP